MPPNLWLPILIVIFFLGAFISSPWLVAISVAVAFIILSARLWSLKSLDNVFYRRRWHYRRGFPGEKTDVRIEVENRKWLPLSWLKISDFWPFGVPPENEEVLKHSHLPQMGRLINIFSLRWFEKIYRKYTLVFKERGVYPVGPVEFTSGDLFGLYEMRKDDKELEYLTVFPELLPMKSIGLETENPMGELRSRRRLFEDPNRPMGVREYRPEDEFRRIHWPATARTGQLQVKIYQPVQSKVIVICLNIATSTHFWLGLNKPLSEHLIK
ncbi:MAG: DUF58 domain-containing protein, partial [Anaerolineaceae bacterium]|nr:DUF58 domain-containing protein [Anaerolineaceae bacterium]